MTHLRSLTDEELLRETRRQEPLVTTDLETELGTRLANAIDEIARLEKQISELEDELSERD